MRSGWSLVNLNSSHLYNFLRHLVKKKKTRFNKMVVIYFICLNLGDGKLWLADQIWPAACF